MENISTCVLLRSLIVAGSLGLCMHAEAAEAGKKPQPSTASPKAVIARAAASVAGAASTRPVNLAKSNVSAVFKQEGVSSEGQFKKFTIAVAFDPANVAETKAQVDIDMTSFDIGDPAYNAELVKKEWFNTAQYPKAGFVSSSVKSGGAGKLDVSGKLTIKGKTVEVSFPVAYKQDGATTVFEGTVPIKRLTFSIGEGDWKDTSVLEDDIRIKFKITLASNK